VIEDTTIGGRRRLDLLLRGTGAPVIEDVTSTEPQPAEYANRRFYPLGYHVSRVNVTPLAGPGISLEDSMTSTSHVVADVVIDHATVTEAR
jgi:hypothetical protein